MIFSNQNLAEQADRLSDAIYNKDVAAVRRLANNQIVNMNSSRGYPPLTEVVRSAHYNASQEQINALIEIAEILIQAGADIRYTNPRTGESLLHMAAQNGSVPFCDFLINKGVNIEAKSNTGATPIISALRAANSSQVIDFLAREGADCGITPFECMDRFMINFFQIHPNLKNVFDEIRELKQNIYAINHHPDREKHLALLQECEDKLDRLMTTHGPAINAAKDIVKGRIQDAIDVKAYNLTIRHRPKT